MGRRYYGIAHSYHDTTAGTEWQVEVHNNSGALDFLLKIQAPQFEWEGDAKKGWENPVMESRCSCVFFMRDGNDYQNFINIGVDEEQEWVMKVLKNGSLFWVGRILGDQISYKREARGTGYASITLKAVDGLRLLSGYTMDAINFSIGDRQTVINTIAQILKTTNMYDFWSASDTFIQDGVQTENATSVGGPLDGSIRKLAFVKNFDQFKSTDTLEWDDCRTGLEKILGAFCAQIIHCEGKYIIRQLAAHTSDAYAIINYDKDGGDLSTGTYTHRQTIETARQRPHFLAFGEHFFQPPVRAFDAEFNRANGSFDIKSTSNTSALNGLNDAIVNGNSPGHPIRVTLSVDLPFSTSKVNKYVVKSTFYARNPTTGQKYEWRTIGTALGWQATSSPFQNEIHLYDPDWGTGIRTFNWVEEMDEPPSGASEINCSVLVDKYVGRIKTIPGPSGRTTVSWGLATITAQAFTGFVRIEQAYNTSSPYDWHQDFKYTSDLTSPRDTNSEYPKIPVWFYNGKKYDVGSYLAWNGSNYVEAGDWSAPWTAETGDLPELVANTWTGLYSDFLNVLRGSLHDTGEYTAAKTLYVNNTIWVLNGGTYNAHDDSWDGEWLAVAVIYTNVTNQGEGQRVVLDDRNKDFLIQDLQRDMSMIRKTVGDFPMKLRDDMINEALGAPVGEPGNDRQYSVQLYYTFDASEPTLQWKLVEENQIVKSQDETATGDASLSNDSELKFNMDASSVYYIEIMAYFTTGAGNFKYALTGPAAATHVFVQRSHGGGTVTTGMDTGYTASTSITAISPGFVHMRITVDNVNAGVFAFQWAQDTSDGTNTTVHAGSLLKYIKQ